MELTNAQCAHREVDNLSDTLVRHFDAALEIAMKARTDDSAVDGEKECLWLFKQAYNAAVDATHQGRSESIVYSLFELSLSFLKLYEESLLAPTFEDFTLHRVLAAYSSCVARFLEIKSVGEGEDKVRLLHPFRPVMSVADVLLSILLATEQP